MNDALWSGRVRIVVEADGSKTIYYQKDGDPTESCYRPSGFFENKAVNGLVSKLQQTTH